VTGGQRVVGRGHAPALCHRRRGTPRYRWPLATPPWRRHPASPSRRHPPPGDASASNKYPRFVINCQPLVRGPLRRPGWLLSLCLDIEMPPRWPIWSHCLLPGCRALSALAAVRSRIDRWPHRWRCTRRALLHYVIAVCSILPVWAGTERNQDGILLAINTYPAEWMAENLSWLRSVPARTSKIEQTAIAETLSATAVATVFSVLASPSLPRVLQEEAEANVKATVYVSSRWHAQLSDVKAAQ